MTHFLAHHLLESTLFCAVLICLACVLRTSAATRYMVWLIGIAKFAVPSVLLAQLGGQLATYWPVSTWFSQIINSLAAVVTSVLALFSPHFGGPAIKSGSILVLWALGTAIFLGAWWFDLRKHHNSLLPPAREEEEEALAQARTMLRVGMPVQVRSSNASTVPALRGMWRCTITLPEGLSRHLTQKELEAVLLHELAHASRLDNVAAVVVHVLVCIFWFHPLVWLVERRLGVERERACDELVVGCGMRPQTYIAGILKVCRFHLFQPPFGSSGITGLDLKHRLELIPEYRSSPPRLYVSRALAAILVMLIPAVPLAGGYCGECVSEPKPHAQFHFLKQSMEQQK